MGFAKSIDGKICRVSSEPNRVRIRCSPVVISINGRQREAVISLRRRIFESFDSGFVFQMARLLRTPKIILLMGVAGSGKTTVGRMLAAALGWPYFEADDFHPPANKEKMSQGVPLDDTDRAPWLAALRNKIEDCRATKQSAVFTCSALKEAYRARLGVGAPDITLVHLTGAPETIRARVSQRQGHYMKADLVQSQFDALEAPQDALTVDVKLTPQEIVDFVVRNLETER